MKFYQIGDFFQICVCFFQFMNCFQIYKLSSHLFSEINGQMIDRSTADLATPKRSNEQVNAYVGPAQEGLCVSASLVNWRLKH